MTLAERKLHSRGRGGRFGSVQEPGAVVETKQRGVLKLRLTIAKLVKACDALGGYLRSPIDSFGWLARG
jgi:hypothetical protein